MTDFDDNYVKQLEQVIKNMMNSFDAIPFNLVINEITGHKLTKFNPDDTAHQKILAIIKKVAEYTMEAIKSKNGIKRKRANEVGNDIEKFVKDAFKYYGIEASTPICQNKKKQSSGYPDIEFIYKGQSYYLECKTYNHDSLNSSLRAFYLSPSKNSKITQDTIHFMLSFEVINDSGKFYTKNYKIVDITSLELNVKYEFNASNIKMYSNKHGAKILYESNY